MPIRVMCTTVIGLVNGMALRIEISGEVGDPTRGNQQPGYVRQDDIAEQVGRHNNIKSPGILDNFIGREVNVHERRLNTVTPG